MQEDRIISKASKLGMIDTSLSTEENINSLASSFNVDVNNLNALENKIDNELAQINYGDLEGETSFGEKEYNAARDENGIYDKDYYSNRQKELDQKVSDAKEERNRDYKKTDDKPVSTDGSNTVGKNKFDKLKDDVNLLNAQKNQIQNKISGAKAKAYQMTHPEEMLKNKANEIKENIKENVKKAVKKTTKEATKKAKNAILAYIKKNPYVLVIGLGIIAVFLILLVIIASFNSSKIKGLDGYDYYPGICPNVKINGEVMQMEKIIPYIVHREMRSLDYPESLKVQAIMARTFIVGHYDKVGEGSSCYYDMDAKIDGMEIVEGIDQLFFDVTEQTRGLITIYNDKPRSNYDASCIYTPEQAREEKPDGDFKDDYYYVKYGAWIIGEGYFQEIEYEKAKDLGTFDYYIEKAKTEGPCPGNHGGGVSQNGARYLEKYENYNWEQIIDFYFDGKAKVMSMYELVELSEGNDKYFWPIGSSETTYVNGLEFATGEPASTRITAYFGGNDSVHKNLGSGGHGAIDIGASQGTNVIAAKDGVVVYPKANSRIDYPNSYIKPDANGRYNCRGLVGNYVEIDHGDGTKTQYNHLLANTITVREGERVTQGQVIGKVGSSGCSTGPHLHFAVYVNGVKVNPLDYVDPSNPRPTSTKTYTLTYAGNYPIDRNNPLYTNAAYLRDLSYGDLLKSKGQTKESFEAFLKSEIEKAGVGTRSAVVTAAMTLIGANAEMGYKLSYEWGGKYNKIGVNENWGQKLANNRCDNYARHYPNNIDYCNKNYNWSGFDCSGFVAWSMTNGFQREIPQIQTRAGNDGYKPIAIDANTPVCKVGSVIVNEGHIILVVKVDPEKKEYTIAQSTGSSGMGLAIFPFNKKGWGDDYVCKNLEELYGS